MRHHRKRASGRSTVANKTHQCRYCQRLFARREHLQRHERTHTNEKPYCCNSCSQSFTRSDLLARHVRLAHAADPQPTTSQVRSPQHNEVNDGDQIVRAVDTEATQRSASSDHSTALEALQSDLYMLNQPSHFAIPNQGCNTLDPLNAMSPLIETSLFGQHDQPTASVTFEALDGDMQYLPIDFDLDIGNPLHENWAGNAIFSIANLPSYIAFEQPFPMYSPELHAQAHTIASHSAPHKVQADSQSARHEDQGGFQQTSTDFKEPLLLGRESSQASGKSRCLSQVTVHGRESIVRRLKDFEDVVPQTFSLPSRLALSRYFGGFIGGFHEHMPFLHLPTMSIDSCPVELLIAIAATGAFYRFEFQAGEELFCVADALAGEVLRRFDLEETSRSLQRAEEDRSSSNNRFRPVTTRNEACITGNNNTTSPGFSERTQRGSCASLELIQTLLLLMAIGTWSSRRASVMKAISRQSQIAIMVRNLSLDMPSPENEADWETWAKYESGKRTRFIVFCFFNLQSLVFDLPSAMTPAELCIDLPCTTSVFNANSVQAWRDAQNETFLERTSFQKGFHRLFSDEEVPTGPTNSTLGNYVLIHALMQQIFLARQLGGYQQYQSEQLTDSYGKTEFLQSRPDHLFGLEKALHKWQRYWQSNMDASSDVGGPIPFNCVALLRLAYIRLHVDLRPSRVLQMRDPEEISFALLKQTSTELPRRPQLLRAVLHATQALSVPVKIGVAFVAQTQTVFWSIQHCLCSFECAVLLASWLYGLGSSDCPISAMNDEERRVVELVDALLAETDEYTHCVQSSESQDARKLIAMAAAVLRLWSNTFASPQIWPLTEIVGKSLNIYSRLLNNENV